MMNQKILSTSDLDSMEWKISYIDALISGFFTDLNGVLKFFENQEVVQSFYKSGILGVEEADNLRTLTNAIERYVKTLTDGPNSLINTIKRFIAEQRDYVNRERTSHVRKAGIQE
ncbi:MAG: hypothetical protein Q4E75_00560 [bacterium]|nr:hypothetical protein [bacterium]